MVEIKNQTDAELVRIVNQAQAELVARSKKRIQELREQEARLLKSAGIGSTAEPKAAKKGRKLNAAVGV